MATILKTAVIGHIFKHLKILKYRVGSHIGKWRNAPCYLD